MSKRMVMTKRDKRINRRLEDRAKELERRARARKGVIAERLTKMAAEVRRQKSSD